MNILEKLDFTLYEKKIIEALLKYSKLNASQISKHSRVPANKVYQTISKLIENKIIIQTNTSPKVYSLQNFDKYIKKKIYDKQKEINTMEDEYENFIKNYKEPQLTEDFWILNDMDSLLKKIENTYIDLENESIGLIETWTARYSTLKIVKQKIENECKVRFMGRVSREDKEVIKKWLKIGVNLKHIDLNNKAGFGVFDNNYIKISVQGEQFKSIWSKNKSLALILENYFNLLWDKGYEITLENIDDFCKNKELNN